MAGISPKQQQQQFAQWLEKQVHEPVRASHIGYIYRFEADSVTISYNKANKRWTVETVHTSTKFEGTDERLSFAVNICKLSLKTSNFQASYSRPLHPLGQPYEHIRKLLSNVDCTDEYGDYPSKPIEEFLTSIHMKQEYRDRYNAALTQYSDGMVFAAKNVPEFVQYLGLRTSGCILYSEVCAVIEVINWFELAYEQSGTLLWLGQCMQHPQ